MTKMNRAQRHAAWKQSKKLKSVSSASKVHCSQFTDDASDWFNPEQFGKGEAEFIAAPCDQLIREGIVVAKGDAT